jgi:hypothetical protein
MYLADVYQCNGIFTKSQVNTHFVLTKPQNSPILFTNNRF